MKVDLGIYRVKQGKGNMFIILNGGRQGALTFFDVIFGYEGIGSLNICYLNGACVCVGEGQFRFPLEFFEKCMGTKIEYDTDKPIDATLSIAETLRKMVDYHRKPATIHFNPQDEDGPVYRDRAFDGMCYTPRKVMDAIRDMGKEDAKDIINFTKGIFCNGDMGNTSKGKYWYAGKGMTVIKQDFTPLCMTEGDIIAGKVKDDKLSVRTVNGEPVIGMVELPSCAYRKIDMNDACYRG